MRSVLSHVLVLRKRRVTWARSCAKSSMALCTTADASVSSPTSTVSRAFLLMLSDGSLPNGSSPDFAAASATSPDVLERGLAGAVSEESFVILQFDVEAVYLHGREPGGTMSGNAGRRDLFVGHPEPRAGVFA
jgi:hypothetical protein